MSPGSCIWWHEPGPEAINLILKWPARAPAALHTAGALLTALARDSHDLELAGSRTQNHLLVVQLSWPVGHPNTIWCCSKRCLVQVGNGIELEAVDLQFEPYRWLPCGVTWDSSRTVVVIKLLLTSALKQWWLIYATSGPGLQVCLVKGRDWCYAVMSVMKKVIIFAKQNIFLPDWVLIL